VVYQALKRRWVNAARLERKSAVKISAQLYLSAPALPMNANDFYGPNRYFRHKRACPDTATYHGTERLGILTTFSMIVRQPSATHIVPERQI
jgi:hypothetical protein